MGNPAVEDLKSIQAHGQIQKTFIYYVVYGEQRRRGYVVPANTYTPRRQTRRDYFWQGAKFWLAQNQAYRDYYIERAKDISYKGTGYDYFMSKWLGGIIQVEIVKSVQRGREVCNHGINNVTITEVALGKTQVNVGSYSCNEAVGPANTCIVMGGMLTTSTNLQIEAIKGAQASNPIAYWSVVEFY